MCSVYEKAIQPQGLCVPAEEISSKLYCLGTSLKLFLLLHLVQATKVGKEYAKVIKEELEGFQKGSLKCTSRTIQATTALRLTEAMQFYLEQSLN